MKNWMENLYIELEDVVELEIALQLMIRDRERKSLNNYDNISQFFERLINDYDIAVNSIENFHRFYITSNIHNILRAKLKPKGNWQEEKVINSQSLMSILALRLENTKLMKGNKPKEINRLKKTYNKLNAENEKIIKEVSNDTVELTLKNKIIPYNDLLELYRYFMGEIDHYDNGFDRLRSLLYLELDFSFVLYNELLRLTHELKKLAKAISVHKLESLLEEIAMSLSNLEFPWIRLKILRACIDNISSYNDIDLYLLDINYVINITMNAIEVWIDEAILEEEVTQCVLKDENRIPYLDSLHENRFRKDSLFSYYNLLRSELELRWLKGRDFNDQDRNRLNRSIKNQPIILWGYN